MYTGTLIDELFATVERAETRVKQAGEPAELERWYSKVHQVQPRLEQNLLGVA
jgi:hypothetical protein